MVCLADLAVRGPALAALLAAGCSLHDESTRPVVRDSRTVVMARPSAGAAITGGRIVLWNLGAELRERHAAIAIRAPADADARDNTIAIDSYHGTRLCLRIDDHVAGGAGNPYEVSPMQLVSSDGLALGDPERSRDDSEPVTARFAARNEFGAVIDDAIGYERYVTRVCFDAPAPIIGAATRFVRLAIEPRAGSLAANVADCCKFTFVFDGGVSSRRPPPAGSGGR